MKPRLSHLGKRKSFALHLHHKVAADKFVRHRWTRYRRRPLCSGCGGWEPSISSCESSPPPQPFHTRSANWCDHESTLTDAAWNCTACRAQQPGMMKPRLSHLGKRKSFALHLHHKVAADKYIYIYRIFIRIWCCIQTDVSYFSIFHILQVPLLSRH